MKIGWLSGRNSWLAQESASPEDAKSESRPTGASARIDHSSLARRKGISADQGCSTTPASSSARAAAPTMPASLPKRAGRIIRCSLKGAESCA